MTKELFLQFKLNNTEVIVERKENVLSFEALENGENKGIEVEESIECKMYKFNIGNDKCIVAFDNDDICLHIIKEDGKDYIYYSLEDEDDKMYTIEQIKEMYEERCLNHINEIVENIETLIFSLDISTKKSFKLNKLKKEFAREIITLTNMYKIELYNCEYIYDLKEVNKKAIRNTKLAESEFTNNLKNIIIG